MKNRLVYHVAPDRQLEKWAVIREGAKEPRKKGLSKQKAIRAVNRLVQKKAEPALVFIHKTRYIIEGELKFSC